MGAENKVLEGDQVITFCLMVRQTSVMKMEKKNKKKNNFELRQIFGLKNNILSNLNSLQLLYFTDIT